jgi:hypothetical protein
MDVLSYDDQGLPEYQAFSRYDFLRRRADGEYEWNDDFLFSIDPAGELASNRQTQWQESRGFFQSGAYGNPQSLETLVLFWGKMERSGYPDAASTKAYFLKQLEAQQQQLAMQQQQEQMMAMQQQQQPPPDAMQQLQGMPQGMPPQGLPPGVPQGQPQGQPSIPPQIMEAVEAQAREAAMRDSLRMR